MVEYHLSVWSMLPKLASPRHIFGQPVREAVPFCNNDDFQPFYSVQPS